MAPFTGLGKGCGRPGGRPPETPVSEEIAQMNVVELVRFVAASDVSRPDRHQGAGDSG
jgi:hypothetical protein